MFCNEIGRRGRAGVTWRAITCGLALMAAADSAEAFVYVDDFSGGLNPQYWELIVDDPLFTVSSGAGEIQIAKPIGGDLTYRAVNVRFRGVLVGDFDVSVAFRDAYLTRLDGLPGNQAQLNAVFGGQAFSVVRSDESPGGGDNHHVFISPPAIWVGTAPDASTAGTMRIRRTGDLVEGFIHGSLVHSGNFNTDDVTTLTLSLANNGTRDSVSVTFDDVSIVANAATAVDFGDAGVGVRLSAPWPNPVREGARLEFGSGVGGRAILDIFDASGRLVRSLLDAEVPAGRHARRWDGRDSRGTRVASGAYAVRLTFVRGGKSMQSTHRIILLR